MFYNNRYKFLIYIMILHYYRISDICCDFKSIVSECREQEYHLFSMISPSHIIHVNPLIFKDGWAHFLCGHDHQDCSPLRNYCHPTPCTSLAYIKRTQTSFFTQFFCLPYFSCIFPVRTVRAIEAKIIYSRKRRIIRRFLQYNIRQKYAEVDNNRALISILKTAPGMEPSTV